jgi:nucleotide-binding universal stress UspA family protein
MPIIETNAGLTLDCILVATDFTEASERASEYAESLARRFSSRMVLTHIVDLSIATQSEQAVVGRPIEEMRQTGSRNMKHTLGKLRSLGIRATGEILEAHNLPEMIVHLANEIRPNLIILGTHARHGMSKAILGSCAEDVIRHATCPVLTVGPRAKKPSSSFSNIVLATGLKHNPAVKTAVALTIGEDSYARVHLCYSMESPASAIASTFDSELNHEEALRKLVPRGIYEHCQTDCSVQHADPAAHILDLARKTHADLIVMGATRSHTWFGSLSNGIVSQVLAKAECPVMTVCTT